MKRNIGQYGIIALLLLVLTGFRECSTVPVTGRKQVNLLPESEMVAIDEKPEETKKWFLAAYGVGAGIGIMLPYSRAHETEADKLGMIFMAMAGYDPGGTIVFWERMQQAGDSKTPEFLSTHPGDQTQINDLKAFLPKAMKYYQEQ